MGNGRGGLVKSYSGCQDEIAVKLPGLVEPLGGQMPGPADNKKDVMYT